MTAEHYVPDTRSLRALREAAATCQGCDLYRHATQTVFGDGPRRSSLMLVGEQPGDHEDREGEPFVGPAGRLLDRALKAAGIDRAAVYLTNAVKHFKFTERGKRRLHAKPERSEVRACRPWLDAEIAAIRPDLIVCLGATAAQDLLGTAFRVTKERGRVHDTGDGLRVLATVHPSAILRTPSEDRDAAFAALVADLVVAAGEVAGD